MDKRKSSDLAKLTPKNSKGQTGERSITERGGPSTFTRFGKKFLFNLQLHEIREKGDRSRFWASKRNLGLEEKYGRGLTTS